MLDSNIISIRGARGRFWLWILCVTGPTKNLYILKAEVVLVTVWGTVCLYLWAIYGVLDLIKILGGPAETSSFRNRRF